MTPDYFKVLQAPLVRGRFFTEDDQTGKQLVAIVDESTARTFWADRDPIGRRLSIGIGRATINPPWLTVVGVIKDIKNDGLDQSGSSPHLLTDLPVSRIRSLSVAVRTSLSATSLEPLIRREIRHRPQSAGIQCTYYE